MLTYQLPIILCFQSTQKNQIFISYPE